MHGHGPQPMIGMKKISWTPPEKFGAPMDQKMVNQQNRFGYPNGVKKQLVSNKHNVLYYIPKIIKFPPFILVGF